jgi:hypothetical protein
MIGSRGASPVKPRRGSSTGVSALRVTAHPFRDFSAMGARAEGDSAQLKEEVRQVRICRWCGGGYLPGLYRAHVSGRTHKDWQQQERRRRAAWRRIAAYRAELARLQGRR